MKSITDNLGYAIKNIRESVGCSQDEVFHGIISRTVWNKYENENLIPDMLMFQVILERLGVSDERFEFIVPDALHKFYEWQVNCFNYLDKQYWDKLLEERRKFDSISLLNKKIQYQYRDFIDYFINRLVHDDLHKAHYYIKKAISHTIKNADKIASEKKRLSVFEWHLIANLYDIEYELFLNKKSELTVKLYDLYRYVEQNIDDMLIKCRIIPKLGIVLLRNEKGTFDIEEKLKIEKNILEISVKSYCIREVPEILRLLIESEPILYRKNAYIKHKEAIEYVFDLAGACSDFRIEFYVTNVKKYMVLSDVLKMKRRETGMSVERLAEGICDSKTYSRAESGKTYPKKNILKKIANKLGLTWIYFKGEIESSKYEDLMLMSKCRMFASIGKNENLNKEKETLKQRIDMSILINKQAIEGLEVLSENISDNDREKRLWEVFSYTGKFIDNRIYTRKENEILSNIARIIGVREPYEGIEMLENLRKSNEGSKNVFSIRIAIILKNLAWLYKNIKEYDKSYKLTEDGIIMAVKENVADLLMNNLDYMSTIKEELGDIEEAKNICRNMFYIAELYEIYNDAHMVRAYYEKVFDKDINWY